MITKHWKHSLVAIDNSAFAGVVDEYGITGCIIDGPVFFFAFLKSSEGLVQPAFPLADELKLRISLFNFLPQGCDHLLDIHLEGAQFQNKFSFQRCVIVAFANLVGIFAYADDRCDEQTLDKAWKENRA